jgi:hypothetical protein
LAKFIKQELPRDANSDNATTTTKALRGQGKGLYLPLSQMSFSNQVTGRRWSDSLQMQIPG